MQFMGTKTIGLDEEAYERLSAEKREGELQRRGKR